METNIRIVHCVAGQTPAVRLAPTGLESWQGLVGGMIESLHMGEVLAQIDPCLAGVDLICNDEGKFLELPPSLDLGFDVIAGDCFFTGPPDAEGNATSLTLEQAERIAFIVQAFGWLPGAL